MTLKLELELPREQVPLGGEVALRLALRNVGGAAAETASLYNNNRITNYLLSDERDRPIATLNHITRQTLMEKTEPRTEDFRLVTLPPGGEELRGDNLCRYHWFDGPGKYLVRGLYRWNGQELQTAPRPLEIVAAPLRAYDQQWCHHYGEKFLLHSAWCAELGDGSFELFLRESVRFRPQVIDYNVSLGRMGRACAPRVSFDTTLVAGRSVWLAWLDGGEVVVVRTRGGAVEGGPHRVPVGLEQAAWAAAPQVSAAGDLVLLLCGERAGAGRELAAIRVRPDGAVDRRETLVRALPATVSIDAVVDRDGGLHLVWLTRDTHEVVHCPVDLAALHTTAPPSVVWRAPSPAIAVLTPRALDEDSYVCCVLVDPAPALAIVWLQLGAPGAPCKRESVPLRKEDASEGAIVGCVGEVDPSGRVYALLTTVESVQYLHGVRMELYPLAPTSELTAARLLVNHRGDVFFVRGDRRWGLQESLVHSGFDDDVGNDGAET